VAKKSPIHLIHHFLALRKIEHTFIESSEGILITGLHDEEFSISITARKDIIEIYRVSTNTGDVSWTQNFEIQLSDPRLFKKLCNILCP
jgi:hypothetical protein